MAEYSRKRWDLRPMQHAACEKGGGKPAVGIAKICPFEYVLGSWIHRISLG